MDLAQAVLLGIIEGVTEFLPVSSTGHLTIVEEMLGMSVSNPGLTAFTAVIQVGAILAVLGYFAKDIVGLVGAWAVGLCLPEQRGVEYRLAWFVIIGSIPVGIVGFLAKDVIAGPLRNLWVVVAALVLWSAPMVLAERVGRQDRPLDDVRIRDAVAIGLVQCLALIPGVSRSGATISAGLFREISRVAATRISFYLSIPALVAAGAFEAATQASAIGETVGWAPTAVATAVSLVVALAAIAWLLRLVAHHSIVVFVWYRLGLAAVLAVLLGTGMITAA